MNLLNRNKQKEDVSQVIRNFVKRVNELEQKVESLTIALEKEKENRVKVDIRLKKSRNSIYRFIHDLVEDKVDTNWIKKKIEEDPNWGIYE